MMIDDEVSGRCGRRWRDCCAPTGRSAGRGAPDEMAAVALHHPGDMMYWGHGIGEGSGFPAVMAGGSDFFAFEPILQN